uniref:Premelanosome protein b n=1 Tax=Pundamilia nyererei TaxID=303518 RepID=A0A3B4H511_9CICH
IGRRRVTIILTDTFISVFGTGGKVTFNVGNDSPTLTGARVTFTIDLQFPRNQKVLPDGDVVWAEDCVINGNSEPVYPTQNTDWEAVFPDGTLLKKDKKPAYVFVWKTWGERSSLLLINEFYSLSFSCSLPKEVCSVLLDSECLRPIHSVCNMVEPSEECQLVLHHFLNDSGVYCINVSLTNDVSLAVTTAAPAEAGRSPLPSSVFCPLVLLSLSLTSPPLLQAKAHMQIDFPVQMCTAWNIPLASMS